MTRNGHVSIAGDPTAFVATKGEEGSTTLPLSLSECCDVAALRTLSEGNAAKTRHTDIQSAKAASGLPCMDDAPLERDADSPLPTSWAGETAGGLDNEGVLFEAMVNPLQRLKDPLGKAKETLSFGIGKQVAAKVDCPSEALKQPQQTPPRLKPRLTLLRSCAKLLLGHTHQPPCV